MYKAYQQTDFPKSPANLNPMSKERELVIREKFTQHLLGELKGAHPKPSCTDVLTYLSERQLIRFVEMKRYVIARELEAYQGKGYTITQAIKELSAIYGFAESELWTIRKDHQRRFE